MDPEMRNMSEPTIICPQCKSEIKLTESLAAPLITSMRDEYEEKISQKELDFRKREQNIREQENKLNFNKKLMDENIEKKLKSEREKIVIEESEKARLVQSFDLEQKDKEIKNLQEILKSRDTKLAEAQQAHADILKKERELDDAKREMDLTVQKKVQETNNSIREKTKREVEDSLKLKVSEKEQIITTMQRQIEELKRHAEQGSQQLQGEVQELELESSLRTRFPEDIIEPVPKGQFGGDILHRVLGPLGICGTILWESKRTKNWSDAWLSKLRDDQRAAKADVALIVSQTLPKGLESFDLIDGVWVVEQKCAIPIAITLRHSLIELSGARKVREGQQTKTELIYQYLTGTRFRQRVQMIVEKFSDIQKDLEKERKMMIRLWAKREAQIHCVLEATAGMYGDLQGIAGKVLQEIDGLTIKFIESDV